MKKILGVTILAIAILSSSVVPVLAAGGNTKKSTTTTITKVLPKKAVKLTKVILNTKSTTINVGSSETLIPTMTPTTATNQNVTWHSNQPKVATVDSSGKVTGVKVGTAVITVVSVEGKKKTTCLVKVVKAIDLTTINSITDITQTVKQGETYLPPQEVDATMSDGTIKQVSVTWDPLTVDTNVTGEKIFKGSVIDYSRQVTLTLRVIAEVEML